MECTYRRIATTETHDIPGATLRDVAIAAQGFRPAGFKLESVGDTEVVGICESCGVPILDGDIYTSDDDGVQVCEPCSSSEAKTTEIPSFSDELARRLFKRLLNPEDLGFAVTAEVRDAVREVIGMPMCET